MFLAILDTFAVALHVCNEIFVNGALIKTFYIANFEADVLAIFILLAQAHFVFWETILFHVFEAATVSLCL